MRLVLIILLCSVFSTFADEDFHLAYVYKESASGCIDRNDRTSCFPLDFGDLIYLTKSQVDSMSNNSWLRIAEDSRKPWWVKTSDIVLQSCLKPIELSKFPVKTYKWDGGDLRYEYFFSSRPILQVTGYGSINRSSCVLSSFGKLLEIHCRDDISGEQDTELLKYDEGKLFSMSCGEWCEVIYNDGTVDIKRFN